MKKTILFLALLLALNVQAQNQLSELNKGLIFHWAGSEWFPTQDLVSGAVGTATATYNVLDKQGNGRRWYSFNGTSDYVPFGLSPIGTGDITIIQRFKTSSQSQQTLFVNYVGGNGIFLEINSGLIDAYFFVGSSNAYNLTSSSYADGLWHTIVLKIVRSEVNGIHIYIDGAECAYSHVGNISTLTGNCASGDGKLGMGTSAVYFSGSISMCRIFNNSTVDIAYYSKPENPIKASDLSACKLDLNAEGCTASYWYDKTNSLTATISGASLVIPPASNMGAMAFNGSTSNVVYSNQLDNLTQFSISFSVYPIIESADHSPVFSDGATSSHGVLLSIVQGMPKLYIPNSNYELITGTYIPINNWTNFVITYNGTTARMYQNGILTSTGNLTKVSSSGAAFKIGKWDITGFYGGLICHFRIYKEVLDLDRIKLINDTNN